MRTQEEIDRFARNMGQGQQFLQMMYDMTEEQQDDPEIAELRGFMKEGLEINAEALRLNLVSGDSPEDEKVFKDYLAAHAARLREMNERLSSA